MERNKITKYLLLIAVVLSLSGCSTMHNAGVDYVKKHKLEGKVTTICYDYWDKKDCPLGTLQADIDILRFIPSDSRFCFGFNDANLTQPTGMICIDYDFIKEKKQ